MIHTIIKKIIIHIVLLQNFNFVKKFDPLNLDPAYKVSKIKTPLSHENLMDALCSSHKIKYGKKPNANRLSLSWSQIALENDRGRKIWNNNLGNQGPFRMDQEYYHHLKKGWPYRSFKNPIESGISYWDILEKCSMGLRSFDDGDPLMAAKSLKNCNYYDTDVESYTIVLRSLYYEIRNKSKCE